MSTTVETEVETTQVYQLFIKASPERVWEAITNPKLIARYFYGATLEVPLESGVRWRAWSSDGTQLWNDAEIFEADPPRRLVHGWKSLYDPDLAAEAESRITWEIEPQKGGYSKLTVVHDRLDASPKTAASVAGAGWMMVLSGLKTLVETGEPIIDFSKGASTQ
jgi:uncharacterized protein YndB with AHSA1/START domain